MATSADARRCSFTSTDGWIVQKVYTSMMDQLLLPRAIMPIYLYAYLVLSKHTKEHGDAIEVCSPFLHLHAMCCNAI